MQNLCNLYDQRLLERLKRDILSGPTLARPDLSKSFYIHTDWYKGVMGVVLLQADVSEEARKLEAQEKYLSLIVPVTFGLMDYIVYALVPPPTFDIVSLVGADLKICTARVLCPARIGARTGYRIRISQ